MHPSFLIMLFYSIVSILLSNAPTDKNWLILSLKCPIMAGVAVSGRESTTHPKRPSK